MAAEWLIEAAGKKNRRVSGLQKSKPEDVFGKIAEINNTIELDAHDWYLSNVLEPGRWWYKNFYRSADQVGELRASLSAKSPGRERGTRRKDDEESINPTEWWVSEVSTASQDGLPADVCIPRTTSSKLSPKATRRLSRVVTRSLSATLRQPGWTPSIEYTMKCSRKEFSSPNTRTIHASGSSRPFDGPSRIWRVKTVSCTPDSGAQALPSSSPLNKM